MVLGNRLKAARELHGKTLREVGAAVSMDPTQLSRIERCRQSCSDEKKLALARYFHVAVDQLFFQQQVDAPSTDEHTLAEAV